MFRKILKNQNGMSLIEVTIAAAISVIVALGVMKINETSQRGLTGIQDKADLEDIKRNIFDK